MSKAKHLIEKVKTKAEMFLVSLTIMLLNVQNVFADVKPDEQGLKDLAAPYIRVGINIGLWALPGCCIFYMLRVAIKWFTSTEEEQQHQLSKSYPKSESKSEAGLRWPPEQERMIRQLQD